MIQNTDFLNDSRDVIIYKRVSTQDQKKNGHSLDAQEENLTQYVANSPQFGIKAEEAIILEDTDSGAKFDRPGLQRALSLVTTNKVKAIVVWRIDRLSRDLKDLLQIFETLKKHDCN